MSPQDPLERTDYRQHTDSRSPAETAWRQRQSMQSDLDRRESS